MAQSDQRGGADGAGRRRLRSWGLWTLPRSAIVLVLLVDATALALVVIATTSTQPTSAEWPRFGVLVALSVLVGEASDRSDRLRRYLGSDKAWVTNSTVWSLAAAATLPLGWAGLCTAAINLHSVIRGRNQSSGRMHRMVFSMAMEVLATIAAAAAVSGANSLFSFVPAGPRLALVSLVAIATFHFVNLGLVYPVLYLVMRPDNWRSILLAPNEEGFELVMLVLGVLTAQIVVHSLWLTPAVLAVLAMLYRGAMVTQLQVESTIDAKTGLLNFAAWRDIAERALLRTERARQPVAVLLIDLDHFKRVNDTYGHLVGDEVLTAVAACIRSDLRQYDAVGRFGGEEFVLLLDNADLYAAVAAATRLRESIAELVIGEGIRVTTSIGVAHSAKSAASLDVLLERADVALYEAKNAGRNTVRALAAFADAPHGSVA